MGDIKLKTGERKTSVSREAVREVVVSTFAKLSKPARNSKGSAKAVSKAKGKKT